MLLENSLFAFTIGLFGAAHCLSMCGGIAAALSFATRDEAGASPTIIASSKPKPASILKLILAYNIGRILSYTLIGIVLGGIGEMISTYLGAKFLRIIAGTLLIAMGLYVSGVWRLLTYLEQLGAYAWRLISPMASGLMPVRSIKHALLLGAIWGWLPCGLVYTALAYATAQGNAFYAGAVMFMFGLGTLPALLISGAFGRQVKTFLRKREIQFAVAVFYIIFGVWTIYGSWGMQH